MGGYMWGFRMRNIVCVRWFPTRYIVVAKLGRLNRPFLALIMFA